MPESSQTPSAANTFDLEQVRALFPQFEVIELIGEGGMGVVFKARQKQLDRLIAIKLLKPSLASDPAFAERFTREARALAQLKHPNIVAVHEIGQVDGNCFFVMEYVDGMNLRQLTGSTRLNPREALELVPKICDALQYAHDLGIVHRDIKPEIFCLAKMARSKLPTSDLPS